VHDVDVDVVGASSADRAHLFAKPRELGREDRRRDPNVLLHDRLVSGNGSYSKAALGLRVVVPLRSRGAMIGVARAVCSAQRRPGGYGRKIRWCGRGGWR